MWCSCKQNAFTRMDRCRFSPDASHGTTQSGKSLRYGIPRHVWRDQQPTVAGRYGSGAVLRPLPVGDRQVGLDSRAGWAAFANATAGYAFAARFTAEPDSEYPDNGSAVEFWIVGRGKVANLDFGKRSVYHMELEVLSPYRTIDLGQQTSLRIEWGGARCPGPVLDVSSAGCIRRKLQVDQKEDFAHLAGAFGVFEVGTLEFVWANPAGPVGEPVTPLAAVLLDRVERVPAAATRLQLLVNSSDASRILAESSLG